MLLHWGVRIFFFDVNIDTMLLVKEFVYMLEVVLSTKLFS